MRRLRTSDHGCPQISRKKHETNRKKDLKLKKTYVDLTSEEDIKNIQKTLDLLEEDDDVQDVYHNWNE